MLEYNIIERKPIINTTKNDESVQYIDLLANVINRDKKVNQYTAIIVSEDYIARPDLISLAVYGDDKFADIICKVNGISNPFELNKNMLVLCPSYQEIQFLIQNTTKTSDIMINKSNTTHTIAGISTNYDMSKETISKNTNNMKKQKNERRSPADQTITDNNFIIDKSLGIVIY